MSEVSSKRKIFANMFWHAFSIFVSSLISILVTPYVTDKLGIEAVGYTMLVNDCISYISLITIALNAFAARYIAIAYLNKRISEANEYYSSLVIADIVLSFVIAIPCMLLIWKLDHIINISPDLNDDVKILFAIVLIAFIIGIIGTGFSSVAYLKNQLSSIYRNKGIAQIVNIFIILFIIMRLEIRVYTLAVGNLIAAIVSIILNWKYKQRNVPEIKCKYDMFDLKKIKYLVSSGFWNSINNVGNMLNSGLDLLICNKMLTTIIMGQVSVAKSLSTMFTIFANITIDAFHPKQLEAYAKNEIDSLQKYLLISMKLSGVLGCVFFACFVSLGRNFYCLWLPRQDSVKLYLLSIIVLLGEVVVVIARPLFYVFTLTNRLKSVCWITILSGFINVISMIVLLSFTRFEGYAVVGTTTVLSIIIQFWVAPYYACKYLKIKSLPFIIVILKNTFAVTFTTSVLLFVGRAVLVNSWSSLIVWAIIFGLASLLIASIIIFSKEEQQIIYQFVYKK